MRIDFTQIEGDVAEFAGSWLCRVDGDGTAVRFEALVDLGIASLADVLDPIAARTLAETISAILVGLFGEDVRFDAIDHETTQLPAGALPFLQGRRRHDLPGGRTGRARANCCRAWTPRWPPNR